ncbi:pentapeptide repeat protein [Pseudomonas phage tabernarius]|uniref:Pentapeptide repeat protein n=1 Tax=Pseudomonas phage tabernarius TaxID=2048978 RepID=A0A2H4P6R1_9CAUD|nr:pentapeptide repeat protein [Pseudomonas phage tabernarius]ATW57867.1 pentapeptide repeat protein [Pseudomonas phage tabernarius]
MQTKKPVVIDHDEFLSVLMTGDRDTLKGNVIFGVKVEGLDLTELDLSNCVLIDTSFTRCNLHKANFNGVHTGSTGVSFIGCEIQGAKFNDADLSAVSLLGCTILGTEFMHADFSRSKVVGSRLLSCNLRGTNFVGADLDGTVFQNNDLYNAIGNGAQLKSIMCAPWPITYTATELQFASHRTDAARPDMIRTDSVKVSHGIGAAQTWEKWKALILSVMKHEPAVKSPNVPFLPHSYKGTEIAELLSELKVSGEHGSVYVESVEDESE